MAASSDVAMLQRLLVEDPKLELVIGLLPISSFSAAAASRRLFKAYSLKDEPSRTVSMKSDTSSTSNTRKSDSSSSLSGSSPRQDAPEQDVSACIIRTFSYGKRGYARVLLLIQTILTIEVEAVREDRVNQLFRGNSLGCKIISTFTGVVGSAYLQSFIEPLITSVREAVDMGVVFGKGEKSNDNVATTSLSAGGILCSFLDSLLSSAHSCPGSIGQMCMHLREIVRQRFPKHTNLALSSFLFLRFFCPAIVSPDNTVGICIKRGDLSKSVRKALIWVAKAVQSLANSVHLEVVGKRSEKSWPLEPDVLHKYRERMLSYFNSVCDLGNMHGGCGGDGNGNRGKNGANGGASKTDEVGSPHLNVWGFPPGAMTEREVCALRRRDAALLKGVLLENAGVLAERVCCLSNSIHGNRRTTGKSTTKGREHHPTEISSAQSSLASEHPAYKNERSHSRAASNSAIDKLKAFGSGLLSRMDSNGKERRVKSLAYGSKIERNSRNTAVQDSGTDEDVSKHPICSGYPGELAYLVAPTVPPEVASKMMGVLRYRTSPLMNEFYNRISEHCKQRLLNLLRLPKRKWAPANTSGAKARDSGIHFSRLLEESAELSPIRGDAYFQIPAENFFEQLCSIISQRDRWDEDCLKCVEVERLSKCLSVVYTVMRTPSSMLSDRDYLYLQCTGNQEIDGQLVSSVISCSVHRGDCPSIQGLVRADINFEGYFVQRGVSDAAAVGGSKSEETLSRNMSESLNEDLGCTVTYLASSSLKGWLPSFFSSQVSPSPAVILTAVAESLFAVADADNSSVIL